MRFLSMIRIDEKTAKAPTERLMTDMGKLIEEMTKAGVLIDTAGLRPSSEGARVRLRGGKLSTIDGPFTEAKEVIGGYAMLQAKDRAEAIEWTKRFLKVHEPHWTVTCEVREVMEG
jgi:hypothetical protein